MPVCETFQMFLRSRCCIVVSMSRIDVEEKQYTKA